MSMKGKERRLFKRVFFAKKDKITGTIRILPRFDEKADPITVNIMNLSAGGAEIYLKREDAGEINVEDHFSLETINGCESLAFCTNIDVEIKRMLDNPLLDNIVLGCEFHGLPVTTKDRINQFVIEEIANREQKS
ncbi:MAG TPA: PilZ domain-containing protein [Desulfobacterales bacterium]|nr:PilZ domain-containing protein [Desulfobacterales bacterium]